MLVENETELLENSALHLLHRVAQCAEDLFQLEMAGLDLTPRQFSVLYTVSRHEGLSQTELVTRTGIDRSTLADLVQRMLRKGLLKRNRSRNDARAYEVQLTEEGWQTLKAAEPIARRIDERLLATLSGNKVEEFVGCLSTIVRELGAPQ